MTTKNHCHLNRHCHVTTLMAFPFCPERGVSDDRTKDEDEEKG